MYLPVTFKKQFRIHSFDCNNQAVASIPSIAKFLQEIAWEHAEKLGVGYHTLLKEDLLWVLYGLKIRIRRFPEWNDLIEIETWGKKFEKLFAFRDFEVRMEGDEESIINATSSWLVINAKSHRPQRIIPKILNLPRFNRNAIETKPADISMPESYEGSENRKIVYSDIDINNHVNNTNYLQFCVDTVPKLQENYKTIELLDFRFVHETVLNDNITINFSGNKTTFSFIGFNASTQKEVFRARIALNGFRNKKE